MCCGVVPLLSHIEGSGALKLVHALSNAYAAMVVPPFVQADGGKGKRSSREMIDLTSIAEYYGERIPGGFSYMMNILPHTFIMEDELSSCWLGQLAHGEQWPMDDPNKKYELSNKPLIGDPRSGGGMSHCGLIVVNAVTLMRLCKFNAFHASNMPHYINTFSQRYGATCRRLLQPSPSSGHPKQQSDADCLNGEEERSLISAASGAGSDLPYMVVVMHLEGWAELEQLVDDNRLLLPSSASVVPAVAALRHTCERVFGVKSENVFLMGWLGSLSNPIADWRDVGDPRVLVLRQLLLTSTKLGANFLSTLESERYSN